ncbi:hypothetical protein L1049_009569 [Liquidambar formosana]|uniref:Uncharacterized protein n=1 Tax=Liquidambar formosana TaxID=63359 RepID=A0AAP0R3K9_LIQFO
MAQMWLLWWPKNTSTTKSGGGVSTTTTTSAANNSKAAAKWYSLTKLVGKLKKRHRRMVGGARRQTCAVQCRYDPLSYSLNFDTSGLDEDYQHFHAFSSRFVANPTTAPARLPVMPTSH